MTPLGIKTAGYVVSSLSVLLLAIVAWPAASRNHWTATALIAGAGLSVLGMAFRWLSYWLESRRGPPPAGKP